MKVTFLGATQTVTGSRYLVEGSGKKILIDCGLFQGYKELRLRNWAPFPINASEISAVILTHAHLDHSGYLPLLVRQGFRGKIYCTAPTFDLCKLLLPDSGYIQEEDALRANKYHYSKHDPARPLYTLADAEESLKYFRPQPFGKDIKIAEGLGFRFERNGHILGASWILLKIENRTVLFSGDIGRPHDSLLKSPVPPVEANYIIVESTYGDRRHSPTDPADQLKTIIKRTVTRGGTIVIPSFAVGRTQSLMYYLYILKNTRQITNIPVYLDSPMAIAATDLLKKYLTEHSLNKNLCAAVTNSVTYVHSVEESKKLDNNHFPKIIIAASGMATGGRVLHHIKHLGPDPKNTILFSGFQAGGTRGDRMVKGEKNIKIHGSFVPINAEILELNNISAHADYEEILAWLGHIRKPPIKAFITHGEKLAAFAMKDHIEQRLKWTCELPDYMQSVAL
jgi:metallo-beta-lactamase family protein